MTTKYVILALFLYAAHATASTWNCAAPRSPDNGLSFIFRNGELVHFRCHPGYEMRGTPVAYCINNVWTNSAPDCIPIRKGPNSTFTNNSSNSHRQDQWKQRELFNWGSPNVYGDGPRRLPLINGIWPAQEEVLALGPQSTPGPKILVKEEIDIAELRHMQLEELKKQRFKMDGTTADDRRKLRHKKKMQKNAVLVDAPRETVLSLGSTEDGEAFSIAFAKPNNSTDHIKYPKHRIRHPRKHFHHRKYFDPGYSVTSRKSRVNTRGYQPNVAELRRRPVEQIHPSANYDTSCVEFVSRREVPMIAPQIKNAFVYRYETKENRLYPFNKYMEVKYKCLSGFTFATNSQTLFCKKASWVGDIPRCVRV